MSLNTTNYDIYLGRPPRKAGHRQSLVFASTVDVVDVVVLVPDLVVVVAVLVVTVVVWVPEVEVVERQSSPCRLIYSCQSCIVSRILLSPVCNSQLPMLKLKKAH